MTIPIAEWQSDVKSPPASRRSTSYASTREGTTHTAFPICIGAQDHSALDQVHPAFDDRAFAGRLECVATTCPAPFLKEQYRRTYDPSR
jgi:hypothetical protein